MRNVAVCGFYTCNALPFVAGHRFRGGVYAVVPRLQFAVRLFLGGMADGGFDTGNAVPRESGGAGLPALSGSLKLRNAVRFFLERNPFSDAETFAVEAGAAESSGACLPEKRLINERFL